MATKTLSKTHSAFITHAQKPYSKYTLEATIDFSSAATTTLAQNDILEAIAIPANCRVNQVRCEVLTVEGAARNYAIGDGSDTDGYIATTTANTLGATHSVPALTEGAPNTITGYSAGKYYAAADTIDVLAVTSGGLTTCKLKVSVDVTDYN